MTTTRTLPPIVLAAVAGVAGAVLALLGAVGDPSDAAIAALIAGGLLVDVRVPWGGRVPMGVAAITATVALLPRMESVATLAVALTVGAAVVACNRSRADALAIVQRCGGSMVGALAAVYAIERVVIGNVPTLASAIGASVGVVVGDLFVSRLTPLGPTRVEVRSALPVHLTLACAGILVAVAVDGVGVAMASVAAFPLLITRFAFERYAGATDTLEQTVQALGLVPELAGLAPLGHSERSARYADALARELGFDRSTTMRVVTATRLHHIGAVPLDLDPDHPASVTPGEIAQQGARILREAALPSEIADLLAVANADALDSTMPTLEAAVVRLASTFDDIVGDDVEGADRGVALVSGAARDPHSRRVAAALLALFAADPALTRNAVAAGDRFREAAVGLDLDLVASARGIGEILPFHRRG